MKRAALVASFAILLEPIRAQAADEPRVLAPSSAWTLDFADERCSLIREFADGGDTIRLQIDSYGLPRRGYTVMLSGDLIPGSDAAPLMELRPAYSPDTAERGRFRLLAGKFEGKNAISFRQGFLPGSPPAADPAQADAQRRAFESSVTHMTLAFRLRKPFRLDTGSMAAPFAAMRKCADDLIASWSIDPAAFWNYSRHVQIAEVPDGYTTISPDSLPRSGHPGPQERRLTAIAQSAESYTERGGSPVPVRLMIDATGQPTACVVQAPASEAYRQSTCQTLAAIRYQPALDAEGRPAASFIQFNAN